MSDLISRQAAIDFIAAGHFCNPNEPRWSDNEVVNFLKSRPSVQPEPCDDAVSRHRLLNDLKELIAAWEKYPVMAEEIKGVEAAIGYVQTIPPVQPEPSDAVYRLYKRAYEAGQRNAQLEKAQLSGEDATFDCISRQAAIDEAEEWIEAVYCDYEEQRERDAIKHVINGIKALPSAQPEPIWGLPVSADRPLADVEIVPRLRDIQKQIPGGSYAIDRAIEIIEAVAERRTDGF